MAVILLQLLLTAESVFHEVECPNAIRRDSWVHYLILSDSAFHRMLLAEYYIGNAIIIGSLFIVSVCRGSPAWPCSERGTHEIMGLSQSVFEVIAQWLLYYFSYY